MPDRRPFIPEEHQPRPREFIVGDARAPGVERVEMDVVIVGGGPSGLAAAIALARETQHASSGPLAGLRIAVLEKAGAVGEHCLSGAVIDPGPLRSLFPDLPEADFPFRGSVESERFYFLNRSRAVRLPVPPPMRNHGKKIVSICEVVRWMGVKAEELGVSILTGYPAASLIMDGGRVQGVRTTPSGLSRAGEASAVSQPPTDVMANVTVLAEGARGPMAEHYLRSQSIASTNPQIFALGVKELWRVKRPWKGVVHTMGWPLPRGAFGGSFFYPLGENLLALGLVVGLDSPSHATDVHDLLQRLKTHPLVREALNGGDMLEWGAKTIPEGGFHSLPERLHGDGVLIVGDSAGLVNVASLKGIHYAVQSGIEAARAIARALKESDTSEGRLASYEDHLRSSFIARDLWASRQMRLGFQRGLLKGTTVSMLGWLSRGRLPKRPIRTIPDARHPRVGPFASPLTSDGRLTFSKLDANFRSGNRTRDDVPLHLVASPSLPPEAIDFYVAMCPAGVYEQRDGALVINAANCIDCKATDVLGPRWTAREGGSGPRYQLM